MRIAINADFRQLNQHCITSVSVDCLDELTGHLKTYTLVLIAEILGGCFGNIITEIKNNRDFREPFELLH